MKRSPAVSCPTCKSRVLGVFCTLSPEELRRLDLGKLVHRYKRGQVLFYEGNPATGLHCLKEGRVKLYKAGPDGHQQIVKIAGPGEALGFRSLLDTAVHGITAEALEPATACFIEKALFQSLLEACPAAVYSLVKTLSRDLEQAESRLLDLADRPAPARLARLLLTLQASHGRAARNGTRLEIPLSRLEIAELIGTAQETAIRLLSLFRRRGFVELTGRAITVRDREGLLRAAGLADGS